MDSRASKCSRQADMHMIKFYDFSIKVKINMSEQVNKKKNHFLVHFSTLSMSTVNIIFCIYRKYARIKSCPTRKSCGQWTVDSGLRSVYSVPCELTTYR